MLERLSEACKKLFLNAFHTVTKSLRKFFPLMLSVLLIECIFFSVIFTFRHAISLQNEAIVEEYDYHVKVTGLTEAQKLILQKDEYSVFTNDRNFTVLRESVFKAENFDPTYTVYIRLLTGNKDYGIYGIFIDDSLKANYEAMCSRYSSVFGTEETPNPTVSVEFSPLYTQEADAASLRAARNAVLVLLGFVCTLVLISFYRIYVNNEKFKLGIYAAFGADFRRLRLGALVEMLICALFTLLPAYYLTATALSVAFSAVGISFAYPVIRIGALIAVLLCMVPILFATVYFPLKVISAQKDTMKLIYAEDNSNLVSSPRRSASMLKRSFPLGYERLTTFRFRRHHLRLALSSALLCVAVVAGFYFSTLYEGNVKNRALTHNDYRIEFRSDVTVDASYRQIFQKISGIKSVHSSYSTADGGAYAELLFVDEKNVVRSNGLAKEKGANTVSYYTGDLRYIAALDEDPIDALLERYTVTGDPYLLHENDNNIIIGSSFLNRYAFNFAPGDTVTIAIPEHDENGKIIYLEDATDAVNSTFATGRELWQRQRNSISYTLKTFSIVAIIEDYPSGAEGIPIVLNPSAYTLLTDSVPVSDTLYLTLENGLSPNKRTTVEAAIYQAAADLGSGFRDAFCTVYGNSESFEERIEAKFGFSMAFIFSALLLLLFIPLNWFYSQSLFFSRRERELYILHSLYAPMPKIRGLFWSNCLTMLPIGLISGVASMVLVGVIYWCCNYYFPNVLQITALAVTELWLPLAVCVITLALNILCSILSAMLPYFMCKKKLRAAFIGIPCTSKKEKKEKAVN